ncbi:hypothetical protein ACSDR0_18500 [Streptosporangium sp. G11]|uniref:hypothetical protein n=1 Tax=Streptosporangium sp. G11 TaxID=3436926 RepID=UPI003EB8CEF8
MSGRGRSASLPPADYRPPQRLFHDADGEAMVVRFFSEIDGTHRDFDFATFPVAPQLRLWFAEAFLKATGPGGSKRRMASADTTFQGMRRFARYLGQLRHPPKTSAGLRPVHLDGYALGRRDSNGWSRELGCVRSALRVGEGAPAEFLIHLDGMRTPRKRDDPTVLYTKQELKKIQETARAEVRAAAARLREGRAFLHRWREGKISKDDVLAWERGWLLDYVDQHGDVPRRIPGPTAKLQGHTTKRVVGRHGGPRVVMAQLGMTVHEAAAAAVLLICLTGENLTTIATAPALFHRPDGYAGRTASVLVDLVKPRRGARKSSMTAPWSDLPPWIAGPPATTPARRRGELTTPFGLYVLLVELMDFGRGQAGTDRLFVPWASSGGKGRGRGWRMGLPKNATFDWGRSLGLPVDCDRLRLTWLERHQRPVAHTEATLANEYLVRSRGDLVEYRKVVAKTQREQVRKARTLERMRLLSTGDVRAAVEDPKLIAKRFDMDVVTLRRVLAGELDTVLGACVDHLNGSFTAPGRPCEASFMLCLSCRCARALPTHLPIQVAVRDEMLVRKPTMTPLRWAERFAGPLAQLDDLLRHYPDAMIEQARVSITPDQRALAQRLLNRELDVR